MSDDRREVNSKDFRVNKGLANWTYLQRLGRRINRRLLEVERRVSHNCGMSAGSIQRVVQATANEDGQKAPGLRFGQPRVMALFVALSLFQHLIDGFQNRDLRTQVAHLWGVALGDYSASQMSYDLRHLRCKGLIYGPPRSRRYFLTPWGWKVTRLFARLEARVFRPAVAAFGEEPSALPRPLRAALKRVDGELDQLLSVAFPLPAMYHKDRRGRNGFDGIGPSLRGIPGSELPLNDRKTITANNDDMQLAYAA